jgi:peroxiredoxin
MKIRYLFILLATCSFFRISYGQTSKGAPVITNYSFKFKVAGLKDVDAYLGFHYGDKKFIKDTAHVNSNGEVEFTGKDTIIGGIYLFITPRKNYFEFVVNETKIQMETDTLDFVANMVVKKSTENTVWYDYMKTISAKQKEMKPYNDIINKEGIDKESKEYKDAVAARDKIAESINKFREDRIAKTPDMLVSKMFKAMKDVDLDVVKDTSRVAKANYFRAHFWDNIDLSDSRLIRTPILESKVVYYFEKVAYQIPDTLIQEVDKILAKTNGDKEMFKFLTHHLTYSFSNSAIMCMDAVFVHLVDKYYRTGMTPWVDQKSMDKMLERADKLKPLLCNSVVNNITLPDTGGVFHSLYDFKGDYTILFFWDATCGHCKKSTPIMADLYRDYLKPHGIEVFGVEGELDDKEWKKYQAEQKLPWLNVSDNPEMNANPTKWIVELKKTDLNSLNFRHIFDLYSYPVIYILDKDKKIIAKKLGVEQIQDFLEKYTKSQQLEKEKKGK